MSDEKTHEFLPHPRPYYPWLILLISLIFQFYKHLLLISPSVIVPEIAEAFQVDPSKLGFLIGMALYSFFIFQIPTGILVDKFGVRRITSLGILLCAIGITLFGYSYSIYTAYVGRILIGLGTSVALINIVKILANWFNPKMFAFLFGVAVMLGALGDLTGIYLTSALVKAVGWRTALMNYGLIGLIFAIIFFIFVKDDAPGAHYDINPKIQRLKLSSTIARMLKRKQSWIIALFTGFAQTPFPVFIGLWGIPYLRSKEHLTEQQSLSVYGILLLGLCISAPIMGYLSTYFKRRKIFITLGSLVTTLLSILIILPKNLDYLNHVFIFFSQGLFFGMLPLCITVMREQNVSKISATAFAFINSSYALFAAIAIQFTGFLFNFQWNNTLFKSIESITPNSSFAFLLRVPFWFGLAFILSLFIKETYAKQKIKETLPREPRKQV